MMSFSFHCHDNMGLLEMHMYNLWRHKSTTSAISWGHRMSRWTFCNWRTWSGLARGNRFTEKIWTRDCIIHQKSRWNLNVKYIPLGIEGKTLIMCTCPVFPTLTTIFSFHGALDICTAVNYSYSEEVPCDILEDVCEDYVQDSTMICKMCNWNQ